ncbi:MAG: DUF5011 domain-containing protein, partial [Candidatus Competibacteraceae bacterium]|nr:DUF5011 domain-containing protein [Candidatus Competibacteraceae bacterium]
MQTITGAGEGTGSVQTLYGSSVELRAISPGSYEFDGYTGGIRALGRETAFTFEGQDKVFATFSQTGTYKKNSTIPLTIWVGHEQQLQEPVSALAVILDLPEGWSTSSAPTVHGNTNILATSSILTFPYTAGPFYIQTDSTEGVQQIGYSAIFRTSGGELRTHQHSKTLMLTEGTPAVHLQVYLDDAQGSIPDTETNNFPDCPCGDIPRRFHDSDFTEPRDLRVDISELLRTIQLYNLGNYHVDPLGEDGFAPGTPTLGYPSEGCPHTADLDGDGRLTLSELLRVIQIYNTGYFPDAFADEDGFRVGIGETPHQLERHISFTPPNLLTVNLAWTAPPTSRGMSSITISETWPEEWQFMTYVATAVQPLVTPHALGAGRDFTFYTSRDLPNPDSLTYFLELPVADPPVPFSTGEIDGTVSYGFGLYDPTAEAEGENALTQTRCVWTSDINSSGVFDVQFNLAGPLEVEVECAAMFLEPGYLAYHLEEGDISSEVIRTYTLGGDPVDALSDTPGEYVITYTVRDAPPLQRTVNVLGCTYSSPWVLTVTGHRAEEMLVAGPGVIGRIDNPTGPVQYNLWSEGNRSVTLTAPNYLQGKSETIPKYFISWNRNGTLGDALTRPSYLRAIPSVEATYADSASFAQHSGDAPAVEYAR